MYQCFHGYLTLTVYHFNVGILFVAAMYSRPEETIFPIGIFSPYKATYCQGYKILKIVKNYFKQWINF